MRVALVIAIVAACGKSPGGGSGSGSGSARGSAPPAARAEQLAKVAQPAVSPACEKARDVFGYGAECNELALPELTSPAGTIVREVRKNDPTAPWVYVLARPDGTFDVAAAGDGNGPILEAVLAKLDARTLPAELLAKLYVTLKLEAAVVRCLPGASDALPPGKDGKPLACEPPTLAKVGDKVVLTFIAERLPHPAVYNRRAHDLARDSIAVAEHGLSSIEGTGLLDLPLTAPLPATAPPVPAMTAPLAWVAAPTAAPAALSTALCASASERVTGMAGRACKAYAYPSLDTPAGAVFELTNDAGLLHVPALQKPDGTIVTGLALETKESPIAALVRTYDPKAVPPEKLAALRAFLAGEAERILCLPGSHDELPDHACDPPAAQKQGDKVVLTYIALQLAVPGGRAGRAREPAVRAMSVELTPEGGALGNGTRLIDLRDH